MVVSCRREFAVVAGAFVIGGSALALARYMPGFFNNELYLAGLIFLQLLVAAVWKFRSVFFAFLMLAFVWAGVDLPMTEAWTSVRWVVLAAGAACGYVLFMHDRTRHFHSIHLVGLFCVLASFVSASVSAFPQFAMLKAASLFLLFLYAGAGGRLGIHGREPAFFRGLLLACELITFLTAFSYFGLHLRVWGNPNSLGLVMGVVIAPLLFWGLLVSETRHLKYRRTVSLCLAVFLLLFSLSRASIIAGFTSIVLMCLVLRRAKFLLQAAVLGCFTVAAAALLTPSNVPSLTEQSTSYVFYKGHRESGVLGSRKSPWQQTIDVISQHPWFGSGFGTSPTGKEDNGPGRYSSNTDTNREHGSSYLAVLEWVGLLGILPFASLLFLLIRKITQVLIWIYHTRCIENPVIPVVLVLVGGIIHASFEDWLFAVGYYLTVFFWTLAFVLFDLAPMPAPAESPVHGWPVPNQAPAAARIAAYYGQ